LTERRNITAERTTADSTPCATTITDNARKKPQQGKRRIIQTTIDNYFVATEAPGKKENPPRGSAGITRAEETAGDTADAATSKRCDAGITHACSAARHAVDMQEGLAPIYITDRGSPPANRNIEIPGSVPEPPDPKEKIIETKPSAETPYRLTWTAEETNALIEGVKKHGAGHWSRIFAENRAVFKDRDPLKLKDKFRNLIRLPQYSEFAEEYDRSKRRRTK